MPKRDELREIPFVPDTYYHLGVREFYPMVWWGEPYAKNTLVFIKPESYKEKRMALIEAEAAAVGGLFFMKGWVQDLSSDRNGNMRITRITVPDFGNSSGRVAGGPANDR